MFIFHDGMSRSDTDKKQLFQRMKSD